MSRVKYALCREKSTAWQSYDKFIKKYDYIEKTEVSQLRFPLKYNLSLQCVNL